MTATPLTASQRSLPPQARRSMAGGVISLIQLGVLTRFTDPAFLSWGWRLPFFFGALLGVAYLFYYARVAEVDVESLGADRGSSRAPLLHLFTRAGIGGFLQVFALMTGMWFAAQMMLSFLPGLLIGVLHQNPSDVSTMEIVANVFTVAGMIGFGALSQRTGRRRLLLWNSAAITVIASLAYVFMVMLASSGSGFLPVAALAITGFFLVNAPLGCIVVYLNERFGYGVRSSGYGTAYTVSLILPALYSVWLGALKTVLPYQYTAVVLILLGGVLFFTAVYFGPETKETDLTHAAAVRASVPGPATAAAE